MKLVALPAFADNYIWMLHNGQEAVVVDPGDAAPVAEALDRMGLVLAAILVTHHHPDHVGGVDALRPRLQGPVYGPARESIPQPCHPLQQGDMLTVLGRRAEVIDVPGHTAGHIAYWLPAQPMPAAQPPGVLHANGASGATPSSQANTPDSGDHGLLFCGDTLFSGGCGRLFEGTPAQMHDALARLATLPTDTRVCCAHEYTLSNLRFAAAVEPGNSAVSEHIARCTQWRAQGLPTLPSTVGQELDINPFMRCAQPSVIAAARERGAANSSGAEVLGALRQWKNKF